MDTCARSQTRSAQKAQSSVNPATPRGRDPLTLPRGRVFFRPKILLSFPYPHTSMRIETRPRPMRHALTCTREGTILKRQQHHAARGSSTTASVFRCSSVFWDVLEHGNHDNRAAQCACSSTTHHSNKGKAGFFLSIIIIIFIIFIVVVVGSLFQHSHDGVPVAQLNKSTIN